MARHRFDEGDEAVKWGGPALLQLWQQVSAKHEKSEERDAGQAPGKDRLTTQRTSG